MKTLSRLAIFFFALACIARAGDGAPAGLHSFSDLYQRAVHEELPHENAAAPQMRLAAYEPASHAPRFTITPAPGGTNGLLLLLAGLAAAGWVAHRRLTYAY
jgi:hypothetical protein